MAQVQKSTGKRTTRKKTAGTRKKAAPAGKTSFSVEERHQMISEAAYFKSLNRPPDQQDARSDWLEAEKEVDSVLLGKARKQS